MPTPVEILVQGDKATFDLCVETLKEYLRSPARTTTVRLALLGMTQTGKWQDIRRAYDALFPQIRRAGMNPHTLARFAEAQHQPRDERLIAHLALLVAHTVISMPEQPRSRLLADALVVNDTFDKVILFAQHQNRDELFPSPEIMTPDELVAQLRHQFGLRGEDHITARHLFRLPGNRDPATINDASYYALYRHSRKRPAIVKSFLAVMAPQHKRYGCFSFTHIYRRYPRDPPRLTHGIVLGFPETIYLVGLSFPKQADGKVLPLGIKAIAIPNESLQADYRCAAGLFMSNAARWQPVIGRVSMLHMGFFSGGGELNHDHANVRLIDAHDELLTDIEAHCTQHNLAADPQDIQKICERVLRDINNCPANARETAAADGVLQALGVENDDD